MSVFVVFCAAMVLLAISTVIYPLLRPVPVAKKGDSAAPRASLAALGLVVVLPVAAGLIYKTTSTFPWSDPMAATATSSGHRAGDDAGSMAEVVATLERRLAENPDDAEGWRLLGRTYLVTGNAAKAVTAYEQASKLKSSPEVDLDLAEAMVLADDPAMAPRARAIVDASLVVDGNNQKALWYSGILAVRANDNETAKASWQKLIDQNPPPEIRQVIASQLTELGVQVPAAATPVMTAGPTMSGTMMAGGPDEAAAPPKGRTLRVAVSVDPSMAAKLKPGVPLFISAREPGIPGPPLAAVRLTADQLPMTVTLSDANAMIAGRNLSSVDDVEVIARVAFGGTAVTLSGDLVGSAVQKKGGAQDLGVVIARIQP